jgi:hypothetical protein
MRKLTVLGLLASALLAACGGGGGNDPEVDAGPGGNIFTPKPECTGASIVPFAGMSPQVISSLEIGSKTDGFDLDSDGDPDNALSAVGSLAADSIMKSLASYDIVIPFEMFDVNGITSVDCLKFAIYLGAYDKDKDADGKRPGIEGGDCDDSSAHAAAVHPGAAEVVGNMYDDDCDGKADEDASDNVSTDTVDHDGDGKSMAQGDCDDTNIAVGGTGAVEICGDGLDNDCDGVADRTAGTDKCSPFSKDADIALDPLSFSPAGSTTPAITFKDGVIDASGKLTAGPSLFSVAIPVTDGITLDLKISGAQIEGQAMMENGAVVIKNARLGGVIDAKTADTIRGLSLDEIGLTPESSLLDATFANLLGPLLALPKAGPAVTMKYPDSGCRTPDIDVDRDGLEAFCDLTPDDDVKTVDVCIDGDGTEVMDVKDGSGAVTMQCSEAKKGDDYRFVDGISVALKFSTSAIHAIKPVEQ